MHTRVCMFVWSPGYVVEETVYTDLFSLIKLTATTVVVAWWECKIDRQLGCGDRGGGHPRR